MAVSGSESGTSEGKLSISSGTSSHNSFSSSSSPSTEGGIQAGEPAAETGTSSKSSAAGVSPAADCTNGLEAEYALRRISVGSHKKIDAGEAEMHGKGENQVGGSNQLLKDSPCVHVSRRAEEPKVQGGQPRGRREKQQGPTNENTNSGPGSADAASRLRFLEEMLLHMTALNKELEMDLTKTKKELREYKQAFQRSHSRTAYETPTQSVNARNVDSEWGEVRSRDALYPVARTREAQRRQCHVDPHSDIRGSRAASSRPSAHRRAGADGRLEKRISSSAFGTCPPKGVGSTRVTKEAVSGRELSRGRSGAVNGLLRHPSAQRRYSTAPTVEARPSGVMSRGEHSRQCGQVRDYSQDCRDAHGRKSEPRRENSGPCAGRRKSRSPQPIQRDPSNHRKAPRRSPGSAPQPPSGTQTVKLRGARPTGSAAGPRSRSRSAPKQSTEVVSIPAPLPRNHRNASATATVAPGRGRSSRNFSHAVATAGKPTSKRAASGRAVPRSVESTLTQTQSGTPAPEGNIEDVAALQRRYWQQSRDILEQLNRLLEED
ncbi:hypothetical protein, conserved [Trypanosoma brucei gambiense DAL972]|uniref:Uncharacterized protein n=1 Tax=Trypanosoma brucei gambiense (strain MHOM/CI/86/DAL972) TaxID=679716 RepID=C9ZV22_TRYB9|nr:hypothetical protein, conserved [Trypanosoma brucei gambiense DAL972]CBH13260.1 hypothetical protein, conserved [Trypanosoma brucei gambiense DAL972]|eukprot:XP_011775537.1 hypothetical protein, conserved [Trypanosoma brucei gambiense DAL972]